MAEGCEWVCAEIGGLKTGGASAGDVQDVLEVLVQGVKQTIGKALDKPTVSVLTLCSECSRVIIPKGRTESSPRQLDR